MNKIPILSPHINLFLARKKDERKGTMKRMLQFGKSAVVVIALVVKICVLIKLFNAALKFKMFLIALATLVLNVVKTWLNYKHHDPHKTIHLEHAHHDHHYDDEVDVHPTQDWKRNTVEVNEDEGMYENLPYRNHRNNLRIYV